MSDLVLVSAPRKGVCTLTLNRPEKRNALNVALLEAFCDAWENLEKDPAIRVVVIRGAGAVFCSGMDLKEARDPACRERSAKLVEEMLRWVYRSPKVTIAAVRGAAVAGGAGLMSACDIAVSEASAVFGYPEVRRGLVAALVMVLLRRQVQDRQVRELLLLGEMITAGRAEEIGLISRFVPDDLLDETVDLVVESTLRGAPGAIALTKELLDALWHHPLDQDLRQAHETHLRARASGESEEGLAAFVEKRPPAWLAPSPEHN